MKKKTSKPKDRCKDIVIGLDLQVHLCRDTITNTKGFFFSMEDKHGNFTGSIVTKKDLKKLTKIIQSFLED